MNTLTSPRNNSRIASRDMHDALATRDPEAADQLVARVLSRAHRIADARNEPNAARVILYVAHLFADELSTSDARFDRLQFVKDVMDDPS